MSFAALLFRTQVVKRGKVSYIPFMSTRALDIQKENIFVLIIWLLANGSEFERCFSGKREDFSTTNNGNKIFINHTLYTSLHVRKTGKTYIYINNCFIALSLVIVVQPVQKNFPFGVTDR